MKPIRSSFSFQMARGIALAVLVALLSLAGFAVFMSFREREAVTQRAEREARALTPRLLTLAQQDFQTFLQDYAAQSIAAWPPMLPPTIQASDKATTHSWKSTFIPTPPLTLTKTGTWQSPVPFAEIPSPPGWITTLTPGQRERLSEAEHLEIGATSGLALQAWQRFADIAPAEAAPFAKYRVILMGPTNGFQEAIALFLKSVPSFAQTETGLSLPVVAALELLRRGHPTSDLGMPLFRALQCAVVDVPTFLTPRLLDAMDKISAPFSPGERLQFEAWRAIWNRTQWARELAARCPRQRLDQTPAEPFWVDAPNTHNPTLLLPLTAPSENKEAQSWLPVDWSTLRQHADWSLSSLQALLPDYAGLELRIGEHVLSSSARASSQIHPALLLGSDQSNTSFLPARTALSLSILLTQPDNLYAQHDRRAVLTTLYLSSMTGIAVLGLGLLWRVFRRQQALAEAQTNFVSSVSHELRAPVAAISLLSENLAQEEEGDPGRRREYYHLILRECRRLASLVENVLDYSRFERSLGTFDPEPTDVTRLVLEVSDAMRPGAGEVNVMLETRVPQKPVEWIVDGHGLERALTNLIDNALKHSPPKSQVVVTLEETSRALTLTVTDQGPGIPAQDHARIFEPFYRRGSELRRETKGVGIGLALVRHILHSHGGSVRVESELGKGSRFILEFPRQDPGAIHNPPHQS